MKNQLLAIILLLAITACKNLSSRKMEIRKIINTPQNIGWFEAVQRTNTLLPIDE
ncbi:MAG: hypothetical protein ACOCWG_03715 [bacterium]